MRQTDTDTHGKQVTDGDRQADGESNRARVVVPVTIDGSKHSEQQHEGDEKLDAHSLEVVQCGVDCCRSQRSLNFLGSQSLQYPCSCHGTQTLCHDVE